MPLISRRRSKILRYVCFASFGILLLDFLLSHQSSYPPQTATRDAADLKGIRSVYIASTQWNSGELLQQHCIPNLIEVINDLRAANVSVFVSTYENGSWNSTKSVLRQLRQTLK